MKPIKILILTFTILSTLLFLTSCKNSDSNDTSLLLSNDNKRSFDLSIYISKPEFYEPLQNLCENYYDETGVIIKVIERNDETNYLESLQKKLSDEDPPTIFSIQNIYELEYLKKGGYMYELSNSSVSEFKELTDDIKEEFKLTYNGNGSYGIPFGLEGFGYIIDNEMISQLFGVKNVSSFSKDFQNCKYSEFEDFIKKLNSYIQNGTSSKITLNNKQYTIKSSKGKLSKNLTGVISIYCDNEELYGGYLINPYLYAIFDSPNKFYTANKNQINLLNTSLKKYSQFLDLITSNVSGKNSIMYRSNEFVNNEINGFNNSLENFLKHKSILFVGNQSTFNKANDEIKSRLSFLPITTPLTQENIKSKDINYTDINNSMSIFIPMYYSINNKATDKEKKLAQDFLYWLNVSEKGEYYIENELSLLPYNVTKEEFKNPLHQYMYYYINENKYINKIYNGVNPDWNKSIGKQIISQYLSKYEWSEKDYIDIANLCITEWKKFKN